MVRFGITPLEAIEAATKNGADALLLGDKLGQIKDGYIADILVVHGDPSQDIAALKNVLEVYQAGELRYRKAE
jgi:imidazolonepropionase-like amidohydrolase